MIGSLLKCLAAVVLLCSQTLGATSTAWEVNGVESFLKGRLSGLQLTADGTLLPGMPLRFEAKLNQPALWSMVAGQDGSLYAATGHSGKVLRVTAEGRPVPFWSAEQSEVFALCMDAKGTLYAGTSPTGGVYRLTGGKVEEVWRSPEKYIWGLQPTGNGDLYVATGENGRIYRLNVGTGRADLYYETGQANVTALALGSNGHLYAGTDPNGLLYDISGPKHATILFDSTLPEIRAIVPGPDGSVYAVGMGGAVATRSTVPVSPGPAAAIGQVVATSPTVITVTESKANGATADADTTAVKPGGADASKTSGLSTSQSAATAAVVEVSGVEKSAIYRISADRTVETLRSSKQDNVYDLILDGDGLLFSTDDHGRVYRLQGRKATLLAEPGDGETTRLLKNGSMLYAALSNPARLLAFDTSGSATGWYQSQVHDSTSVARWGHLQWHGTGSGLAFRTRTGNSARPDSTWSAWSAPTAGASAESLIKSPPARFIQWRGEWAPNSTAEVNTVDIPYLPQNTPPQIRSITVTSILGTNAAKSTASAASASVGYSVTVTDTGEAPAASTGTAAAQTVSRLQTTQTQISWQADDPDSDKLVYSVSFRPEEAKDWQLIRTRMSENTLLLDPDVFADGRYFFRIIASDAPSNAAEYARTTELVSAPVLIDNTPPLVTLGQPNRTGTSLDVDIDAVDKTSSLKLCEYSLDAGSWQPIEAADGITDSPHELFHLHLEKLRPGEHLIVVRVYDSAANAGLARLLTK